MPTITTPAQRLERMLKKGARLMALCPGHTSIDITPDVIAMLDTVQNGERGCKTGGNLFEPEVHGREVATRVHFV